MKIVVRKVNGMFEVFVKLANGHEFKMDFGDEAAAADFAEGVRQGLVLALNAVGFVPAVKHEH